MNQSLAICTYIVIGVTWYFSYRGFHDPVTRDRLVFEPLRVLREREYYRLVSSGFIHGDWWHFAFNMFSLYSFASNIEQGFGALTMLWVYFAGIVGGNLLSFFLHRSHDYRALGASGGVCGVIFASIFLIPNSVIMLLILPIPIPAPIYAILFLFISFHGMRKGADNIGHDAHLGGALVGLLAATALHPYIVVRSPVLYFLVMAITGGMFWYAYRFPSYLPQPKFFSPSFWKEKQQARREERQREEQLSDQETMDRLLDKISHSGMDSLSAAEKRQLKAISQKRA